MSFNLLIYTKLATKEILLHHHIAVRITLRAVISIVHVLQDSNILLSEVWTIYHHRDNTIILSNLTYYNAESTIR